MDGTHRRPYKYRPLDRSKNEIRLIFILNHEALQMLTDLINEDPEICSDLEGVRYLENEDPVHCSIHHVPLDSKPAYIALSYTWGEAGKTRPLVIEEDGEEFELRITENLDSALRNLGLAGDFWIDAVCINQSDELEKSWQVQQMWRIYNSAECMATWLGTATDDSDVLMDQISKIDLIDRARDAKSTDEFSQVFKNWAPPEDFISLPAFSALTKRAYWRRVWIQQELHASSNGWLHCGRKRVPISLVYLVLLQLEKMQSELRKRGLVLVRRDSFAAYLGMIKNDDDMVLTARAIKVHQANAQKLVESLPMLLKRFYVYGKGLEASDPRDFIYGLLNMSTDPADLGITADYSKSKQKLFIEVATALIKRIGLQLLLWRNTHTVQETELPLPSWAPD